MKVAVAGLMFAQDAGRTWSCVLADMESSGDVKISEQMSRHRAAARSMREASIEWTLADTI